MIAKDKNTPTFIKTFDPQRSIQRAERRKANKGIWTIKLASGKKINWTSKMDRVKIIRRGLPYNTIEIVSSNANLSIKQVLQLLDIPQTTYNKKKKENDLLSGRDSEIILVLVEVLEYGLQVFNNEKEKFYRWLKKPNISLGGEAPEKLFDSLTGIQEVQNSLNRVEYGNLA